MTHARIATESLLRRYLAPPPGVTSAPGCPEPARILAAVLGERPVEENRALASHGALCPSCAIAWQLARDWAAALDLSRAEARPPARAGFGRSALAAAATILLAAALMTRERQAPPPAPVFRSSQADAIESLVPEGGSLPASSFVLRWSAGPPGCRYNVRVTDRQLNHLAGARALAQPEYTVPPDALYGLEPGSVILWQVEAIRQDDSRTSSLTFSARIE